MLCFVEVADSESREHFFACLGVPGQGSAGMKGKTHRVRVGEIQVPTNEQVRREMQNFLRAIDSYPDRFARDPDISFDEHRSSLSEAAAPAPSRRPSNSR